MCPDSGATSLNSASASFSSMGLSVMVLACTCRLSMEGLLIFSKHKVCRTADGRPPEHTIRGYIDFMHPRSKVLTVSAHLAVFAIDLSLGSLQAELRMRGPRKWRTIVVCGRHCQLVSAIGTAPRAKVVGGARLVGGSKRLSVVRDELQGPSVPAGRHPRVITSIFLVAVGRRLF
jgi:hypothetical protein